ncbi:SEC-C metal-binding domain-containing protein [Clostridium cylindrosporum]|uniref:SEC-C domain-containing protein n=1 Tax=Clostridium cylindrosporum DSM 605 TaxID=1121307 RepID=A0A0J8DG15_CLOCY|nr:SEC-C metal-binding domain-containing protein [Clostridium cylindrosporum]KMT23108.1 SEC-C domain-containing protein [Clostridium cylindrosporum DSM 605]
MSLFKQWEELVEVDRTQQESESFWKEYLEKERDVYIYILKNKDEVVKGTVKDLAEKFNMDSVTFAGFVSGIETSLKNEINLDSLEESSEVELNVDFEKLFYNMLDAKADWLFTLEEWEEVLSLEAREAIAKEYKQSKTIVKEEKIGRNDPCKCGSGKKYKKCCGK